jgi:hypothetical protein
MFLWALFRRELGIFFEKNVKEFFRTENSFIPKTTKLRKRKSGNVIVIWDTNT